MPMITPLSSPRGTNRERLYIDAAWLGHSGIAYDSKFGLARDEQPESSKASQIAQQLVGMLSQDELTELGNEVVKARNCKYGAAKDEDPSLNPYASAKSANFTGEQKKRLNAGGSAMDSARRRRIAMDAKWASALKQVFARPGSATYDQRERRKMASDAATMKSFAERFPDAAKIVVQPETVDRNAGPHSMANDGRLVRSLEERYPDLKKIGFAL
jgi:hypothetical protein